MATTHRKENDMSTTIKNVLVATTFFVITVIGSTAAAQVATTNQNGFVEEPSKKLTLSFSPVHLLFPFAEVTGEYAVSQNFGVAGIAGLGGYNGAYMLDVGAQAIYYVTGSFEQGVQVGGEAVYAELGASSGGDSVALVSGLGVAPFLGYKMSARNGFTGILQAGPQLVMATSGYQSAAGVGIMLNANVGWTF
jgi:hypothetical protein